MEILQETSINTQFWHVDISLVRYPMGEYRVLANVCWHLCHRGSGYLRTTGFGDNRPVAAENCYHRTVAKYNAMTVPPAWYTRELERTA